MDIYYQVKSTSEQRILSGINKDINCIMMKSKYARILNGASNKSSKFTEQGQKKTLWPQLEFGTLTCLS